MSDPGVKSGISVRELISTKKEEEEEEEEEEAQAGNEWSNILPKLSPARKKPPLKVLFAQSAKKDVIKAKNKRQSIS